MVGVLLDTCVLSELQRSGGNPAVRTRVAALDPDDLFLSVITLGEVSKGIALLPHGPRRRELAAWLEGLARDYGEHIVPVDVAVAHAWGELTARARTRGIRIPASDGLIAATALVHGLRVMTRNTKHFAASGVPVLDPWALGD